MQKKIQAMCPTNIVYKLNIPPKQSHFVT